MAADHHYVLRDSVTWSVFFLAIIAVLWLAQRDRKSSPDLTDSQFAGRDIVPGHDPRPTPVLPRPPDPPAVPVALVQQAPVQQAQVDLKEAEQRARQAKEDLEKTRADLAAGKKELEAFRAESDANTALRRKELEQTGDDLDRKRRELEQLSKETDDKVRIAKEDLATLEAQREKKVMDAAAAGIAQGLGRGRLVDAQTAFNPRAFRNPNFPTTQPNLAAVAAAGSSGQGGIGGGNVSFPGGTALGDRLRGEADLTRATGEAALNTSKAGINVQTASSMELDNRLKYCETFHEMRRVNRANRAIEWGPRPTMEQIVKMARMNLPKRLSSIELDPVTGEISWPVVLMDLIYEPHTQEIQNRFVERAMGADIIGYQQVSAIESNFAKLKEFLRDNIDKYAAGRYGQARSFLDSLAREYEMPLN